MSQFAYDARNRLTSATMGGVSVALTYDAEGHRQSLTSGGQTTTYTVNPHAALSQCVARMKGSSITWAVYGQGLLWEVEEVFNTASTALKLKDVLYHHHDQVGNTAVVTNRAGQDVIWVQYDVYGQVVACQVPKQRATSTSGTPPVRPPDAGAKLTTALTTTTNPAGRPELDASTLTPLARALLVTPYLYSGAHGVMTDPTGLIHMRARYYHPGIHRFVNQDPVGFDGGMNWYGYCGGDPLFKNDPNGLVAYALPVQFGHDPEFTRGFYMGAGAAVPVGLGVGAAILTGPIIGGAALSAGINSTNQILNIQQGTQQSFSGTEMAVHGMIGSAVPAFLNRVVPAAMSWLPNSLKGTFAETFSWINGGLSGRGWAPIEQQTLRIVGRSPRPDFTYPGMGTNGATLYVEAKFGTSTLTSAQRVAANRLGENWITESWTYGWMGSTAAGAGNAAMGLGNMLFGSGRGGSSSSRGGGYGRK